MRIRRPRSSASRYLLLLVVALAGGCGSDNKSAQDMQTPIYDLMSPSTDMAAHVNGTVPGEPCMSNVDCGAGWWCAYPIIDACKAMGECHRIVCAQYVAMCGCDGKTVNGACFDMPGLASAPTTGQMGACPSDGGI